MTQYKNEVIRHAMLLEAEEWSKLVDWIHVHKLDSMWYDEWPKDTKKYSVCDTKYNDGTIERKQNGKVIRIIGKRLSGDDLIDKWARANQDKAEILQAL